MNPHDFAPPFPRRPDRGIGLVGCGWVAGMQLEAYRAAGFTVVALVDHDAAKAEALRDAHYPDAVVHRDVESLLADEAVEVVDVATHVGGRSAIIESALRSGRPVLTQKPFVEDLDEGERLAALATELGRPLAVNHNGRWAPHFAVLLATARNGVLGAVTSADFSVSWPHHQVVADMPAFANMEDLVLYDFGIHWFDVIAALVDQDPLQVFAQVGRRPGQGIGAPTQAQVVIAYPDVQVSLVLRAAEPRAEVGAYRVSGTAATLVHEGTSLGGEAVRIVTGEGEEQRTETVAIGADWFGPGMAGTMGELLLALDEGRPPVNDARSSLRGLSLCFAAVESARTGVPVVPGSVRRRPVGAA
ncbi:Gfo/Idh/MocA family protein [Pedococcus sp. NPDC057267]|uniref:Gfo/Idh/MocA family protein n=1 Tax=Pedococcus sp. NPDC057267 TaxID=3346077 RepID=UPI00363D758E